MSTFRWVTLESTTPAVWRRVLVAGASTIETGPRGDPRPRSGGGTTTSTSSRSATPAYGGPDLDPKDSEDNLRSQQLAGGDGAWP